MLNYSFRLGKYNKYTNILIGQSFGGDSYAYIIYTSLEILICVTKTLEESYFKVIAKFNFEEEINKFLNKK